MIFFRHLCERYNISTWYPGRGMGREWGEEGGGLGLSGLVEI